LRPGLRLRFGRGRACRRSARHSSAYTERYDGGHEERHGERHKARADEPSGAASPRVRSLVGQRFAAGGDGMRIVVDEPRPAPELARRAVVAILASHQERPAAVVGRPARQPSLKALRCPGPAEGNRDQGPGSGAESGPNPWSPTPSPIFRFSRCGQNRQKQPSAGKPPDMQGGVLLTPKEQLCT
jgi:hypothetical protein